LIGLARLLPFTSRVLKRTYSHRGEDILIEALRAGQEMSFIDIGSGLPCWGNNTYALYRKGLNGLLVDPIGRNIKISKIFRPRDKSVLGAVGMEKGSLVFYQFEPYEFSTLSFEVYKKRIAQEGARFLGSFDVPIYTLKDLFEKLDSDKPVFLSIDVEGYELEVLRGNDWEVYKPYIICIEEWENPINANTEVRAFLESMGYSLQIYNGLNSFYRIKSELKL
jgi:hypothetical protein